MYINGFAVAVPGGNKESTGMPFDGKRMIFCGFEPLLEKGEH